MADCNESKPKPKVKISSSVRNKLEFASEILKLSKRQPNYGFLFMMVKIGETNANKPVAFDNATCSVDRQEEGNRTTVFSLTSIYKTGAKMLNKYLKNGEEPENEEHWYALKALVDFLEGTEWIQLPDRLSRKKWNEAEVSVILLHHFLSHLQSKQDNLNPPYILDKYCTAEMFYCPCCLESLTGQFGDTSIGNTEVWHGRIDAMIGDEISITNTEMSHDGRSDSELESPNSSYSAIDEVKKDSVVKDLHQILAQTITFSFLQHSKHPEQVPLYPNISISKNLVQFHMYDSVNDILLESQQCDLIHENLVKVEVVLALWLVLNHSLFSTGLSNKMKKLSINADFLKGKDAVKEIYKTKLEYHCGPGKKDEFDVRQFFINQYRSQLLDYESDSDTDTDTDTPPAKKPKLETSSLGDGDKSV